MKSFDESLEMMEGGRLLDVAAGRGSSAQYALSHFRNVSECIGIDISPENVETATKAVIDERVRFKVMNAEQLDFPDNSFDIALMFNSLHHMNDKQRVLSEIFRVLKPGGRFVLSEMHNEVHSAKELNHVDLHHWWAMIDMKNGIPHHMTYSKKDILQCTLSLPFSCINCFESDDCIMADKDTIQYLCTVIDNYMNKAEQLPEGNLLLKKGMELKNRILSNGLTFAPSINIIAVK